jgi:hypothetical protein
MTTSWLASGEGSGVAARGGPSFTSDHPALSLNRVTILDHGRKFGLNIHTWKEKTFVHSRVKDYDSISSKK